ncbi:hypothetical protein ABGB17_21095 [Sphaerisporangium sp. B11E5]|uniref:hypothetical protein n=1 Tax=Sphaerisporangium sp. B11E5 TaxID=3153563 RepID=UPI00325CB180
MCKRAVAATVAVGVTLAVAGCASGQDAGVLGTVDRFYAAVRSGDGGGACALLTPDTAEALASEEEGCAAAVVKARLPAGAVLGTQVWGSEAQVRLSGDTVFLHRFPKGWLIRAAGCTPRGEKPYRCEVES